MQAKPSRTVYPYRGRWLPLLPAVAAAALAHHELPLIVEDELMGWPPGPVLVASGFALVWAFWLALARWRAYAVTPAGIERRAMLWQRRLVPWAEISGLWDGANAARLDTMRGPVRIGPELARWRELVAELQARVSAAPEHEPLTTAELAAWLGERPIRLWAVRAADEVFWPLCLAGFGCGGVLGMVAFLATIPRDALISVISVELIGTLALPAMMGAVTGLVWIMVPAVILSLPLRVVARPGGLVLSGVSRWRARRSWQEVRAVRIGSVAWSLVTENETLRFITGSAGGVRLRAAASQVLAARREGRAPQSLDEVPSGALSRVSGDAASADRGLSRGNA